LGQTTAIHKNNLYCKEQNTQLTSPKPKSYQKSSYCRCPRGIRTTFCPVSLHS